MRDLKGVEERILDKALYLFGKNGSTNVPIRAIAKEAGVNVSAINYYFRSKDEMLKNVQEFYIDNMIMAFYPLDNSELSEEDKLIGCANEIIEYSTRYPGVHVMNKEAFFMAKDDEMAIKILTTTKEMNNKLDKVLKSVINSKGMDFKYKRMIFLSSILHPVGSENYEGFDDKILDSKKYRISYIKYIINLLKE